MTSRTLVAALITAAAGLSYTVGAPPCANAQESASTPDKEAADLRDVVKSLLQRSKQIVIDLAGVTYIDSGGLGTLVGLYTSARNLGGEIKLSNLTQRVHDQLQITKLITVFDCYDNEQAAVNAFPRRATA